MGDYHYPEQLNDFASHHTDDLLLKAQDLIHLTPNTDLLKLKPEQLNAVLDHFMTVNTAFFSPDTEQQAKENQWGGRLFSDNQTGLAQYQTLSAAAEAVTRSGHSNALNYPYSYFLHVIDNLKEAHNG